MKHNRIERVKELFGARLEEFSIEKRPCVYFLVKDGDVVYVGRTASLVKRMKQHLHTKEFDSVFYVCVAEGDLETVEVEMITHLMPNLNKIYKVPIEERTPGWESRQLTLSTTYFPESRSHGHFQQ